ncbi:antibiotic biosynthesis monooxygenase [Streptomyces sp. 150FB]|uniref:putative quinol monooxygenase n=1 Tax=Streptomyces sp. 150FB TaxID=1576605 RepID=UPI000588E946|nr:putative quinol monooxygenase [Streptomyces sp. 150FB]KIF74260.1 antibiotic biosynthesis monooxygenase [Streptomyces sp. 150FB]
MAYGYIGSMKARPGHRDDVVALLLGGVEELGEAGCGSYVVSTSAADEDMIWVMEVWRSKEHHDASLRLPEAKAAIGRAMPMLTGEFSSRELEVVGGLGVRV